MKQILWFRYLLSLAGGQHIMPGVAVMANGQKENKQKVDKSITREARKRKNAECVEGT